VAAHMGHRQQAKRGALLIQRRTERLIKRLRIREPVLAVLLRRKRLRVARTHRGWRVVWRGQRGRAVGHANVGNAQRLRNRPPSDLQHATNEDRVAAAGGLGHDAKLLGHGLARDLLPLLRRRW
jgi:hypothetical protein